MTRADKPAPEQGDFSAARELFFEYDGSRFYMSRDDVEATYLAYNVPEQLERQWLGDLTKQRLELLQSPGNWWSIHFLADHQDWRHLREVLRPKPIGVLWQRITFAEELLSYVEMCARNGSDVGDASAGIDQVLANARALLRSCRSDRTRGRVNQLVVKAERARSALRPESGASGV